MSTITKLDSPWRLTFDTNPDLCNIHCIICEEHSEYNNKHKEFNRLMKIELIDKVVSELSNYGLKEIIPSTMGEPLLYKEFGKLLDIIKDHQIKINLTTNGTFPSLGAEGWGNAILPIASDVKISINGASKAVNESIMSGIDSDEQLKNIMKFVEIRDNIRLEGINYPTISFQVTFLEKNLKELPDLLKIAIKMDIDRFKGHHVWITHPELFQESLRRNNTAKMRWNNAVKILEDIAQNYPLKNGSSIKLDNIYYINEKEEKDTISDDLVCPFLGKEAWIAYNGDFNVCCAPDKLRRSLGSFGNIINSDFITLWNSKEYQILIENWGNYKVCQQCNMRRPLKDIEGC